MITKSLNINNLADREYIVGQMIVDVFYEQDSGDYTIILLLSNGDKLRFEPGHGIALDLIRE